MVENPVGQRKRTEGSLLAWRKVTTVVLDVWDIIQKALRHKRRKIVKVTRLVESIEKGTAQEDELSYRTSERNYIGRGQVKSAILSQKRESFEAYLNFVNNQIQVRRETR